MNADEIMRIPPDQLILLTQNRRPYIGKKNVYFNDPRFNSRIAYDPKTKQPIPAFSTREEALKAAKSAVAKLNKRRWFDRGEVDRSVEMSDDDVSSMWKTIAGLYDEPDPPANPKNNNFTYNENDPSSFI